MCSMTGTIRASCSGAVCCGWISRPKVSGAQGLEEHLCCSTARRIPECRSARQFISASCLSYFLSPRHAHTHTSFPSPSDVFLNVGSRYRQSVIHTNNASADKAEGKRDMENEGLRFIALTTEQLPRRDVSPDTRILNLPHLNITPVLPTWVYTGRASGWFTEGRNGLRMKMTLLLWPFWGVDTVDFIFTCCRQETHGCITRLHSSPLSNSCWQADIEQQGWLSAAVGCENDFPKNCFCFFCCRSPNKKTLFYQFGLW